MLLTCLQIFSFLFFFLHVFLHFFFSLGARLLGVVPLIAIQFTVYEYMKARYLAANCNSIESVESPSLKTDEIAAASISINE